MTPAMEADRVLLQAQANDARARLLQAIAQLDTRTRSFARGAAEVTRVSGWGIAGAFALWAGVAWLTRDRERKQTALVRIAAPRPSLAKRTALHLLRGSAAITGFLGSSIWALRLIELRRRRHAESPAAPHLRQLGHAEPPLLLADLAQRAEARGTTDA